MISKLSVILLICIILIPPSQCGEGQPTTSTVPTAPSAVEFIQQGDLFFEQGSYDEAIDQYNKAININPDLAEAYWGRGKVYHFDKGLYSRAIDDYSRAIELNSAYTEAYYYRGLAREANGVYDRAIEDFSKAIELDPSLAMAYNVRAWCYAQKAQWDLSSQRSLSQMLTSDQDLAEAYKGPGWSSVKQMQWELFTVPYLVEDKTYEITENEHFSSTQSSSPIEPDSIKGKFPDTPYVKIMPVSGPVGTKLIIYGWGFRSGEDGMTITWDDEIIMVNILAETDGSMIVDGSTRPDGTERETIYVPESTQGKHIIGVYGSSFTPKGIVKDNFFEVTPRIVLKLKPDIKGTQVTVVGTGFAENESIIISLDGKETETTAITDSNGNFTAALTISTIKEHEYTTIATGNKNNSSQASFTVNLARPIPDKQEPDIFELYCNRGYAHFKKAQWALAIIELDNAYAGDSSLNKGPWNKDWAEEKQSQWDAVISDYDKAIDIINGPPTAIDESGAETFKKEIALALADYKKAVEMSGNPTIAQKMREAIEFIEEWNDNIE